MLRRLAFASAALLGVASAQQLNVTSPNANDWWVAGSSNTLAWTCNTSPYQTYTILVTNSNPAILSSPIAIISVENNYDCSKTITQQQFTPAAATGYIVQLANPLNETDVYAESEPFEVKAAGSAFPTTTSGVGSATGSSASASASATGTGGALAHYIPAGMSMAAALALGLIVA